jgi:hypothetical protein
VLTIAFSALTLGHKAQSGALQPSAP